jgi:hypothetical protein
MVSILPRRFDSAFWPGFFSPLRYFRELIKTGLFHSSVPALSTAWMIEKKEYQALGGIESVARKVVPEHYFAKQLSRQHKYAFLRTNDFLQVATAKSLTEQIRTSLRVIYPGQHRRMEWTLLASLGMFVCLCLPFFQFARSTINDELSMIIVYGIIISCLTVSHLLITTFTNPILWPLALLNLPYLASQEIVLTIISMYKYEFGEVYWKERNICLPVLQAIPRLPDVLQK